MSDDNEGRFHWEFVVSPVKITRFLGWVVFALILAHILVQAYHFHISELPWLLREIFDPDEEPSFATWFSTLILFVSSVLLFLIASNKEKWNYKKHWYGLGAGFAFMSLDEVAGMHETFNTFTDFAWTIPAAVGVVVLIAVYFKFLVALPQPMKSQFIIAGLFFLSGALVVEHLADYYIEAYTMKNFGYNMLTAFEETLEMVGVVLFIRALLLSLVEDGHENVFFKIN